MAPVRVGEELDVKIEAVGEKGDGIARRSGFVLFVPQTKSGDDVRIRVTRVLKNVGFAEVIGKAEKKAESHQPSKPAEEEVNLDESLDSEDFGDSDSSDDVDEDSDDSDDDSDDDMEEEK